MQTTRFVRMPENKPASETVPYAHSLAPAERVFSAIRRILRELCGNKSKRGRVGSLPPKQERIQADAQGLAFFCFLRKRRIRSHWRNDL